MKSKTILLIGAAVALLASAGAQADRGRGHSGEFHAYAKVVDVQPIVRVVQVTTPRESCWDQPVTRARYPRAGRSGTPVLLGGILGGVVGNQFGSGRGNDIMTVAGALLGASIGRDAANQRGAYQSRAVYTSTERRCEIENVVHEEERVEGYNVTYKYQGRTFVTQMPRDPGDRVRIRIQVASAAY